MLTVLLITGYNLITFGFQYSYIMEDSWPVAIKLSKLPRVDLFPKDVKLGHFNITNLNLTKFHFHLHETLIENAY